MRESFKRRVDEWVKNHKVEFHPAFDLVWGVLNDDAETRKEHDYLWTSGMLLYRRWALRQGRTDEVEEAERQLASSWKRYGRQPRFGPHDVEKACIAWLHELYHRQLIGVLPAAVVRDKEVVIYCSPGKDTDAVKKEWENAKHIAGGVRVEIRAATLADRE